MKKMKNSGLPQWTISVLVLGIFAWAAAAAIEPDEVRRFEDVFVISAQAPDRSRIEVNWEIAPDYFLYNNRFLNFSVETPGVQMGTPEIPRGKMSFDELLGEQVEKYHGKLTVTLPLISVDENIDGLRLKARSQGCLEGVLCYPPTEQIVLVGLPPAKTTLPEPDASETGHEAVPPARSPPGMVDVDALLNGSGNDQPDALTGPGSIDQALPADSAFIYEAIGFNADTILVRMTAQPGYYLYRDKFAFSVMDDSGFSVREVSLPDGVVRDDPEFGSVPVIYGQVEIPVRMDRPAGPATTISLRAEFQGCRDGDICYPPMSRIVSLEMPASATAFGAGAAWSDAKPAPPVSEQNRLARLLTENVGKAIFAFFVAGILLAFTPCVFPMVPILSGIIAGQGERLTSARAFWLSLVYVLAMAVTYTAAGILAGLFGQNLQAVFQNPWILSTFVLIFIFLALSMFGFYELQLPGTLQTRLAAASNRQQGGSLWGVMVMGLLSALIVGPCVAPPLMAALIVIGSSGDAWLGGSALFALSMGMGVPLIVFGVSAGKLLPRAGRWMDAVKAVFGVGLLALAIWMLERLLPGGVIMLLWGALAIACGVYLRALEPLPEGISPWWRLWKALGLMLLLAGILELVGAAAGGGYWLRPLDGFRAIGAGTAENRAAFQRIKSLDDLNRAMVQANAESKGVMLDFYADWCVECLRMERNTFHEPEVRALLNQMQLLQADVTANDTVDQELLSAFGIIGPPAILFFDRSGEEMEPWRLVGYFPPDEFAAHLTSVLTAQ